MVFGNKCGLIKQKQKTVLLHYEILIIWLQNKHSYYKTMSIKRDTL